MNELTKQMHANMETIKEYDARLDAKDKRIVELETFMDLRTQALELKADDRWRGSAMELWSNDLAAKNPELTVPDPTEYRRE